MAEIGILNEVGEFSQFVPLNEQDKKTYEEAQKRNNNTVDNNHQQDK